MCTVTFFPTQDSNFVLTSNRDESPVRNTLSPDFYSFENTKLMYPEDELAGGSWIGVSEKQRLLCVLNGGFTFHERKTSYRLSRGVVLKDLLVCDNIEQAVKDYNLVDVEPFTLVIVDWFNHLKLMQLVWDGEEKHVKKLPLEAYIWSSSSLYSEEMKAERKFWFENFKAENELNKNSVLEFHTTAGKGNLDYGVIMDRKFVKTTSITQVSKTNGNVEMIFNNLAAEETSHTNFKMLQSVGE